MRMYLDIILVGMQPEPMKNKKCEIVVKFFCKKFREERWSFRFHDDYNTAPTKILIICL